MLERTPVFQLLLCHIRGYLREPEAIFWTYGFPLLLVIGLGIAFDASDQRETLVDLVRGQGADEIAPLLEGNTSFRLRTSNYDEALQRLKRNQTQIVVTLHQDNIYRYRFDPSNPEALAARSFLNEALQTAAGRADPLTTQDQEITVPGSRYVDFLVPGLIGLNLMGGGMWGIGFVLVDMRIKKLLKRMLGTPMKRPQFLLSIVGTRTIFFIPEAFVLLIAAHWIFGVPIQGSLPALVVVAFVGAMAFAGLGLLAASRAQRIETISGILNVVMLPMWLCSGIFFSAERFPVVMQPFIQALPLTQLINALRAVILEGQTLAMQILPLAALVLWAGISFLLALKSFRWT
jgi:ABC-type multidrug transport system permease subunit